MADQYYCEKCGRTKAETDFYVSNNLEKYPNNGKLNQCKKCLTMHVDNWDPDTYLWILEEIDVPYIPDEWNKLLAKWGQNRAKLTGMSILGRYLSKMQLRQFADWRWKDNAYIEELRRKEIEETMKKSGYSAAEIHETLTKGTYSVPEKPPAPIEEKHDEVYIPQEDYFDDGATDALIAELTDEDRIYLRLKWGKAYKPDEWVALEQLYNEMMESYDIQSAGDKNTLILACKTSLKANQLLDIGDIDGAQKMTKMYDSLMKSGKWTAAQNKAEKGEYVDSLSELIALCERDGFIPRYYVDTPQDKVDRVIQDLESYTRNLVIEEMHLGPLIERAVRQIEEDRSNGADDEDEDNLDELERRLYDESEDEELDDEDYADYYERMERLRQQDEDYFNSLLEEDDE